MAVAAAACGGAAADEASPGEADIASVGAFDAWGANDVSFLFPFPAPGEAPLLLPMAAATPAGDKVLLPESVFTLLGTQASGVGFLIEAFGRDKLYTALRVVAARVDPCFDAHDPRAESRCVRQVRLTVQPVVSEAWDPASGTPPVDDGQSPYLAYDASLHLFYALDDDAFVRLLAGLRELKTAAAGDAPLGVHPVMAREGLAGPFASRLRELLLDACDASRLTRMTAMRTGRTNNWFWNILEPDADGRWGLRGIPGLPEEQSADGFTQWSHDPTEHQGTPIESPLFPNAFVTTRDVLALSEAEFLAGVEQLQRIENPTLLATGEVGCAACHVAGVALGSAWQRRGLAEAPTTPSRFVVPPGQNATLADETGFDGSNLHAFSWFGRKVAVSQRAVNESVAVAAFLGTRAFTESLSPSARAAWLAR